jgi:hypothetical protein
LEALYDDLSLYVRQSAWLNATPERAKHDESTTPLISRLQRLRADRKDENYSPPMPPLGDAGYLIGYLWAVGPTVSAGSGMGQITHEELRAWQSNIGIECSPWEIYFLRRLSQDYLSEHYKAAEFNCPAPWSHPDLKPSAASLKENIRNLAKI